jgi:hypothetical protein
VTDLAPAKVVASFDSATVLHASLAAALAGRPFPHLGHSAAAAAAIRAGGRLPWPVLRRLYTRIGASEGIPAARLGDVDMAAVAAWLAGTYPRRRYPAALIGSSNGALTHLAAAMQAPWLPGTVLVPVSRTGDPQRPADALRFGQQVARELLDRNRDIVLHHMHDQVQDELMVARMTYFRLKWRALPTAYAQFLADSLIPGAPVVLIEDRSTWPVRRIADRHLFQSGAQGGLMPDDYLKLPHTPQADDEAAEAEWGADPQFTAAVADWCSAHGHPMVRVTFRGPQAPAHAVATTVRSWYAARDEPADRLLVPSFVLGDPWRTINTATVPFWTFFSVQAALRAFESHLENTAGYRIVDILQFQHGVRSAGIATPEEWAAVARRHGATPRLLGLDPHRFPHDIAIMGRYGKALDDLPSARHPWSPLTTTDAIEGLRHAGMTAVSA